MIQLVQDREERERQKHLIVTVEVVGIGCSRGKKKDVRKSKKIQGDMKY